MKIYVFLCIIVLMSCNKHPGHINYLYDFGTASSPLEQGYLRVDPGTLYQAKKGYGLMYKPTAAFDTIAGKWNNALNRDGLIGKDSLVFRTDLPKGAYVLTITLGNNTESHLNQSVYVNGVLIADTVVTPWYRIPIKSVNKSINVTGGATLVRVVANDAVAAVQSIEFRPIAQIRYDSKTGFEPDTTKVKQMVADLERQLQDRPGQTDLENQLNTANRYLKACYYYDLGAWLRAAKTSGINFTFRMYLAADLLEQVAASKKDPLYDQSIYLLGKIHYWLNSEDYDPYHEAEYKKYFSILKAKYPDADLLKMYLGERVPFAIANSVDPKGAPQWAIGQHEAMQRMLKVIYWWVNERQEANGELGGKYGDDVEILRWWLPAILGADDATAKKGYRRLADGVWNSGILERGFAKKMDDVEHAAELFRDTHPSMFMIDYGDPEYVERCLISMQNFGQVWTGITPNGHRHFKSCYLSATAVLEKSPMNVDVPLNARAVLPGLWAAWYNQNPELIRLFSEWGNAWVNDADRAENGKPAGVLPAAIAFENDGIAAHTGKWYDPGLAYDYYRWESLGHVNELQAQLIGMYAITKNKAFLKPLNFCYDLMISAAKETLPENPEPGSLNWVKQVLLKGGVDKGDTDNPMADVFAMARQLSGSQRYDQLIEAQGSAYNKYLIHGDTQVLNKGLEEVLASLRYNFPLLTNEVKYTDRVYVPGSDLLFGMYTGHFGAGYEYPAVVATWKNTGPDLGILVRGGNATSARVSFFNFGTDRAVTMQTWQLQPGLYALETGEDRNDDGMIDANLQRQTLELKERVNQVVLHIPAKKSFVATLNQIKADAKLAAAADAALSAHDISMPDRETVAVKIHNIGNLTAKNITVELWAGDEKLGLQTIGRIDAPNDLVPRVKVLTFKFPGRKLPKGIRVQASITAPEISTLNNKAAYP